MLKKTVASGMIGCCVVLLNGCDEDDIGSGYVEIKDIFVKQNDLATKAIQLNEQETDLVIEWNVAFASPSNTFELEVYLGSERYPERRNLFVRNCSRSAGDLYDCDGKDSFSCSFEFNVIDCERDEDGVGQRHYITNDFDRVTIEACIVHPKRTFEEKRVCDTVHRELTVFQADDDRLAEYNYELPESIRRNGYAEPASEDDASDSEDDQSAQNTDA
ncbi:hypothetical protein OLMES_3730 [Oleiphilus messinensis]|uniref:Uncharacterized protein n=1 Tax=Oleiphilus messinensis TaxID=141451 RepID=A0A1Y0IB93_9GAMM|nr:hypothetical protein [Oleiphilus messinensis]ARU57751.1 hypothetical protein OLMES_3730 [Oleiphilus messinensis]